MHFTPVAEFTTDFIPLASPSLSVWNSASQMAGVFGNDFGEIVDLRVCAIGRYFVKKNREI